MLVELDDLGWLQAIDSSASTHARAILALPSSTRRRFELLQFCLLQVIEQARKLQASSLKGTDSVRSSLIQGQVRSIATAAHDQAKFALCSLWKSSEPASFTQQPYEHFAVRAAALAFGWVANPQQIEESQLGAAEVICASAQSLLLCAFNQTMFARTEADYWRLVKSGD